MATFLLVEIKRSRSMEWDDQPCFADQRTPSWFQCYNSQLILYTSDYLLTVNPMSGRSINLKEDISITYNCMLKRQLDVIRSQTGNGFMTTFLETNCLPHHSILLGIQACKEFYSVLKSMTTTVTTQWRMSQGAVNTFCTSVHTVAFPGYVYDTSPIIYHPGSEQCVI